MFPVERGGHIVDQQLACRWVDTNPAWFLFSAKNNVSLGIGVTKHSLLVLRSGKPGSERQADSRQHVHAFELDAVSLAVLIREFVDDGRQDVAFPRSNFFVPLG